MVLACAREISTVSKIQSRRTYVLTEGVTKRLKSRDYSFTCLACGKNVEVGQLAFSKHSKNGERNRVYHESCHQQMYYES